MTEKRRSPKDDLLVGGLDDWVDPGWAANSVVMNGHRSAATLRDATLSLIAEAIKDATMIAGDLLGNEHVPWHGTPEDWIDRIEREWRETWGDELPTPGAIVWLNNTPKGDAVARAVLAREV